MSSSPSRVEQAEIVLSDSDTTSVLSVSATRVALVVVSAIMVMVDMLESGSGEVRGRVVESLGERARISNLVPAPPFLITLSLTTGE